MAELPASPLPSGSFLFSAPLLFHLQIELTAKLEKNWFKWVHFFSITRSYAALRAADLDWTGSGGYILGCSQCLASCLRHSAQIGPDLLCHPSFVIHRPSSALCPLPSVVRHPPSVIRHLTSVVCQGVPTDLLDV